MADLLKLYMEDHSRTRRAGELVSDILYPATAAILRSGLVPFPRTLLQTATSVKDTSDYIFQNPYAHLQKQIAELTRERHQLRLELIMCKDELYHFRHRLATSQAEEASLRAARQRDAQTIDALRKNVEQLQDQVERSTKETETANVELERLRTTISLEGINNPDNNKPQADIDTASNWESQVSCIPTPVSIKNKQLQGDDLATTEEANMVGGYDLSDEEEEGDKQTTSDLETPKQLGQLHEPILSATDLDQHVQGDGVVLGDGGRYSMDAPSVSDDAAHEPSAPESDDTEKPIEVTDMRTDVDSGAKTPEQTPSLALPSPVKRVPFIHSVSADTTGTDESAHLAGMMRQELTRSRTTSLALNDTMKSAKKGKRFPSLFSSHSHLDEAGKTERKRVNSNPTLRRHGSHESANSQEHSPNGKRHSRFEHYVVEPIERGASSVFRKGRDLLRPDHQHHHHHASEPGTAPTEPASLTTMPNLK